MPQTRRLWGGAKSASGVWGLTNVFASGKLYFTRDVLQAKYLPQGQEPPANSPAKPAAGEPIPTASVEHVQRFRVKYSRQRRWSGAGHASPAQRWPLVQIDGPIPPDLVPQTNLPHKHVGATGVPSVALSYCLWTQMNSLLPIAAHGDVAGQGMKQQTPLEELLALCTVGVGGPRW